jgi:hypothetical protein
VPLLLDGIKFMMVGGDQWDVRSFCQGECQGVRKGYPLFYLHDPDSLDKAVDYKEYATWPFENEHEGDVEGCCVVFERSGLEDLAPGTKTAGQVTAHTVITSVHEEFHDSDCVKRLPLANAKARDDLVVYVAPGSHATYLTPGSHDFLDFEDVVTDLPAQLPTWVVVLAIIANLEVMVDLVLLAGILEHFVGSDDETSDNGVSVGPGEPDPANLKFEKKIEVTPLFSCGTQSQNLLVSPHRPPSGWLHSR